MKTETLRVDADTTLALRVYEPAGAPHASVVIGAAMGVRQDFYAAFAAWLAEQGFRVTTFDYRGHGYSLQGPMRAVRADLLDWVRDYEAVIATAKAAQPAQPLFLIGHSLGAQLPGLMTDTSAIDGMLGVAAGSGYWRDNAPRLRTVVHFFWWVLVPMATWLCGYFPGRRLRSIGDLPKGVILQWRRWCLNPRYGMGAEGAAAEQSYAAVRFPIVAYSLADDELMTLQGIERLNGFYAQAPSKVETIAPQDVHAARIGHFGFFRPAFRASLWPRAAAVLSAFDTAKVTGTTNQAPLCGHTCGMTTTSLHAFDQALQLRADAPGQYQGESPKPYWNMVGPFGGVTAATLLQAVLQHPDRLGDPLALTVNYGGGLVAGSFQIQAVPVRTNRSTQHWTLSILQAGPDGAPVVTTTGTAVTALRRETWSVGDAPAPQVPKPADLPAIPPAFEVEWLRRYEMRPVTGVIPQVWDGSGDHSLSQLWMRDAPPRALDFCSLAAMADIFFPRVWLRRARQVPAGTVSITVYFHASQADLAATGDGYLLGQARGQEFRNGFFDHSAQLWNEAGTLLATSHQIVYYKE